MASSLSIPPPLSPILPDSQYTVIVTTSFIVNATIDSFDNAAQNAFAKSLAAVLRGVRPEDISLSITPASIRIVATINVRNVTNADSTASAIRSASLSTLSTSLGVPLAAVFPPVVETISIAPPSHSPPGLAPTSPQPARNMLQPTIHSEAADVVHGNRTSGFAPPTIPLSTLPLGTAASSLASSATTVAADMMVSHASVWLPLTLLGVVLCVAGSICCYVTQKASEVALDRKIQRAIDTGKTVRASQLAAAELESSPLKAMQQSSDDPSQEGYRSRCGPVDLTLDDADYQSKGANDTVNPSSEEAYVVEGGWNLLAATRARLTLDHHSARTRSRVERARRINRLAARAYASTPPRHAICPTPCIPNWDEPSADINVKL